MACPKGHVDSALKKVIIEDGNELREYFFECNKCKSKWIMTGKGKPLESKEGIRQVWDSFVTGSGGPTYEENERMNKEREDEKIKIGLFKYFPPEKTRKNRKKMELKSSGVLNALEWR